MRKVNMLFIIIVMFVMLGCINETQNPLEAYSIEHYSDTIHGQEIITTVCHNNDYSIISVSTVTLGRVDSIDCKSSLERYLK